MKLGKLLFKPKWQDKDTSVRRLAIAADMSDGELAAALPEIARRDEDAGVRLAALQRLADYEAWRERSTGDTDGAVRGTAREAYLAMLCTGGTSAPPLSRRIAELETLSEDEIERVASQAAEVVLRREAIARVAKQTLIAQRAAADPDAGLRLELIERVTDATLLERIAERTRKTDKAVSRRARERLQASAIARGDAAAIAERARALCERAEALMRAPHANSASALTALDSEWQGLGQTVPADLSARFNGARVLAHKALQPRVAPLAEAPPPPAPDAAELLDAPAVAPIAAPPVTPDPAVAAQERAQRAHQKGLRHELETALREFSAALDSGDSSVAHRLHTDIEQIGARLGAAPAELRAQLEQLQPRYAELKRWQHWSNNQRRRTLCTEIEALVDAGMHPDAVATRVHDAREEWQKLNAAEGIAEGAEAVEGLARRFHGASARALRPTRAYFAKRKEVRRSHADEIAALVARARAIADDSTDWKAIAETQSHASQALRGLDGIEPRLRTQLAKQLKEVIARMAALSAAHERDVEAAKARLIVQATALSANAGANAPREARELQQRWTALGNGRRATDQKQWREFRSACDAVFGKLDAARKQREDEQVAAHTQTQEVLDGYAALAGASENNVDDVRRRLRELDARWSSVAGDDRALSKRQRELRDAIMLHMKAAERSKRLGRFSAALLKYAAARERETSAAVVAWDTLPCAAEFDAPLAERYAQAQAGAAAEADAEAAREILVRLEFVAGIDSPAEDRQLRMNHQVQRLSSRMRDGASANPERELSDLLKRWFGQAPQTTALEQRFERAARAAIDSLP